MEVATSTSVTAKYDGRCLDRCGLRIHAGHDQIEHGTFGWRHADCEQARVEAWVRERYAAGDECADIQIKLLGSNEDASLAMHGSCYALDHAA